MSEKRKPWIEDTRFRQRMLEDQEAGIRGAYAYALENGVIDPVIIIGFASDPIIMSLVEIAEGGYLASDPTLCGIFAVSKELITAYWEMKSPGSIAQFPWDKYFPTMVFARGGCLICGVLKT